MHGQICCPPDESRVGRVGHLCFFRVQTSTVQYNSTNQSLLRSGYSTDSTHSPFLTRQRHRHNAFKLQQLCLIKHLIVGAIKRKCFSTVP